MKKVKGVIIKGESVHGDDGFTVEAEWLHWGDSYETDIETIAMRIPKNCLDILFHAIETCERMRTKFEDEDGNEIEFELDSTYKDVEGVDVWFPCAGARENICNPEMAEKCREYAFGEIKYMDDGWGSPMQLIGYSVYYIENGVKKPVVVEFE